MFDKNQFVDSYIYKSLTLIEAWWGELDIAIFKKTESSE